MGSPLTTLLDTTYLWQKKHVLIEKVKCVTDKCTSFKFASNNVNDGIDIDISI